MLNKSTLLLLSITNQSNTALNSQLGANNVMVTRSGKSIIMLPSTLTLRLSEAAAKGKGARGIGRTISLLITRGSGYDQIMPPLTGVPLSSTLNMISQAAGSTLLSAVDANEHMHADQRCYF